MRRVARVVRSPRLSPGVGKPWRQEAAGVGKMLCFMSNCQMPMGPASAGAAVSKRAELCRGEPPGRRSQACKGKGPPLRVETKRSYWQYSIHCAEVKQESNMGSADPVE